MEFNADSSLGDDKAVTDSVTETLETVENHGKICDAWNPVFVLS